MDHHSVYSGHEPGLASGLAGAAQDEEYDEVANSTLYELTDLQEYTARKVEADDLKAIRNLLKDEDYNHFHFEDPVILYETCCFSLAVFDVIESDRLVAAAFFDDKPTNPDLSKLAKKWKASFDIKSMSPINTLHMRCFVCNPEVAEDVCLTEIISHTFSSSIHIEYIVVELPNVNFTGPYVISPLVKELEIPAGNCRHEKKKVIVYKKDLLMPHLLVREGREHDLDDLMPLLPLDMHTMEQHFGKSNLSDVIAMSEKGNQSMVAEWKGEATGIISVSADLDYELLNEYFHLEPFHGLHKPHKNDQIFMDDDSAKTIIDDVYSSELYDEGDSRQKTESGLIRIQRQGRQPYDVELIKEFSLADGGLSDDDSSGVDKLLDEKTPKPHLFTTKVDEDIILYGLRKRLPVEGEEEEGSGSLRGSEEGSSTDKMDGTEYDGDEDEEEYEEKVKVEEEEEKGEDDVEERGDEDDEEEKAEEKGEEEGEGEEETDGREGEEGEEEDDEEEGIEVINGDDLVNPSNSEQLEGGEEEEDEEGEGGEEINIVTDLEEEGENEGGEDDDEEEGDQEQGGADEGADEPSQIPTEMDGEEEEIEDEEGVEGGRGSQQLVPEPSGTSAPGGGEPSAVSSKKRSEDVTPPSPTSSDAPVEQEAVSEEEEEAVRVEEDDSSIIDQQSIMQEKEQGKQIKQTKSQFTDQQITMLQQMSPEVRRRMSEDAWFVGKRPPKRNLDQKIELFKTIYHMIQEDNEITLKQAKEMLPQEDREGLEEARVQTIDNLHQYLEEFLLNNELRGQKKKSVFHGIANALAVKLFNMNKKHMLRHMDLFRDIFKSFPNREYLVITVPIGDTAQPCWLQNFVRAVPRVQSCYPRDLFLIHKVAITAKVRVRKAKERDMSQVKEFLSTLLDKQKIYEDFIQTFSKRRPCKAWPKMTCYVAEVKNYENTPIIGLAMVSTDPEVLKYSVNYEIEKHTYFAAHDVTSDHGYVHHMIINPLFQRHSKLFLKEVMRLDNKQCLFHRVYPDYVKNEAVDHQSIINNMEDWIPLMPRKRVHYDDLGLVEVYDDERQPPPYVQDTCDPYALIHIGKKFILEPKITLTKRLVFVGASTTTLACLEKLISSTYRSFRYLTVIDPYGLPGQLPCCTVRNEFFGLRNGGTKMSYDSDPEWVQRTGIHLWVQVVIGRVTSIKRDAKYVVVNEDNVVQYDKLVLAPGQQFQRLDCPEPEINDPNFTAFKKNTATHEGQHKKDLKFTRDTPKPENVFMINNEVEAGISLEFIRTYKPYMKKKKVVIFGGGLPTFCCVKALIAAGIAACKIVLVGTPDKSVDWEKRTGYILSSKVRLPMKQELRRLGVCVVDNYEFSHWETCSVSGLVKRTHFKSSTERDAHISVSTFALFCYRYRRVDDGIVSALSDAYILYQDGIVIDAGFRTGDHNIYAAGPAATYQKILLADHQNHIYYQSEDVGYKLAELLIESCGSEGGDKGHLEDINVIKFKRPLIRAVKLLGDWYYLYLRSPGNHSTCIDFSGSGNCEESCECTTEVVTGSVNKDEDPDQKFFKLRLDDKQRIISLECMSKSPFSFSNMASLYGQHETLLNKLMERLESGETTCLYNHFQQSWFSLFCIDEWSNFRDELKDLYREHDIGSGVKLIEFIRDFIENLDNPEALQMDPNIIRSVWRSSKLKDIVEEKLLNFLKFHRWSLPMYASHNYVEDLLEERSNSTLYYPNNKAHMVQ